MDDVDSFIYVCLSYLIFVCLFVYQFKFNDHSYQKHNYQMIDPQTSKEKQWFSHNIIIQRSFIASIPLLDSCLHIPSYILTPCFLRTPPSFSAGAAAHTAAPYPRASCSSVCTRTRSQLPRSTSSWSSGRCGWPGRRGGGWCRITIWWSRCCPCRCIWCSGARSGSGGRSARSSGWIDRGCFIRVWYY